MDAPHTSVGLDLDEPRFIQGVQVFGDGGQGNMMGFGELGYCRVAM